MNPTQTYSADRTYPYVLACSTFGTIISLATVWLSTAASFSPAIGA
jgi:hypothetical protein